MSVEDMLSAAIGYTARGWIVHRIYSPAAKVKAPGKQPMDTGWQKVTTPPTEGRLDAWFGDGNPHARNIGLLCGAASGVTVIDLDRVIYADIFDGVDTLRSSRTTGRCHIFFTYNPRMPGSKHHNLGIEVLSDGNNAIVSPSVHKSGDVYSWDDPAAPLAEMPTDVELKLANLFKREKSLTQLVRNCRPCFAKLWKKETRSLIDFHGAEGRELMVAWGTDLKAAGATLADCEMWARVIYGDGYDPATTMTEWRGLDQGKTWRCATIVEKLSGVIECACDTCAYHPPTHPRPQAPAAASAPVAKGVVDDYFDKSTFIPKLLADVIMSRHVFKTLKDTAMVYVYEVGVYVGEADKIIEAEAQIELDYKTTSYRIREVVGFIQRATYTDRESFDADPNIINLANGLFDFKAMELRAHTPTYPSLHKSPLIYNPDAVCPRIDLYFEEVLLGKDIPLIYELFGYALLKEKRMDTAVLFEGSGANGKSRMIDLLNAFVGGEATSHITPSELSGDDTFAAADLFGMLLNTIDDLGNTPLKNLGVFKSVVSGAEIRAQHKFERSFVFRPEVLCVFGCNDVPITTDTSGGFFRRMITVSFLQKFEGDDRDENLVDKLTTSAELSGLFNAGIEAVKTMIEQGRFTGAGTIEDKKQAYQYASNSVARFVDEECDITDPEDYISKDELYNAYVLWARDRDIKITQKGGMTIYLEGLGVVVRQFADDFGYRYRAYDGIKMKVGL